MWDSKKIRDKQFGFTLMETLVATAIMAILACLVIPAVITIQRNLYMAKLDDYARQIFMAAQNEMSSMKDSGRLDAFAKELANMNGRRLEQEPQDFPAESGVEAGSESWRDLFAVTSSDAVIQNYLIRADNSLQQATENNGVFWIELNPLSGDVYSVFYAETLSIRKCRHWQIEPVKPVPSPSWAIMAVNLQTLVPLVWQKALPQR